jgi:hypothetical protein
MTDDEWNVLEPCLASADEGFTRCWVELQIDCGAARLFTYGKSAAVVFPRAKKLRIGLAGGELSECQQIESQIEAFAKSQGIPQLEIVGRDWRRALPGYAKVAVILRKTL